MTNCPPFDCACGESPLTGYSSEATDLMTPLATAFVSLSPPLDTLWCEYQCMAFAAPVVPPQGGGINPVTPQFFNSPQTCTVDCPDGTPFVFEVSAGSFSGNAQAAADNAAEAFACSEANRRQICLSALSNASFTIGVPFSATITATGQSLAVGTQTNLWQMISGSLPTGLTFNGGNLASDQVTITGTPTETGTFSFGVSITDPLGDTQEKFYTLNCPIGFNITNNLWHNELTGGTAVGFALSGPADAGYDTQYKSIQNACGVTNGNITSSETNDLSINFVSPTLQTWNLKVVMTLTGNINLTQYSLTINGAVQPFTLVGNIATFTGSFQTNNCANTVVAVHAAGEAVVFPSNQTGCVATMIEWLTP